MSDLPFAGLGVDNGVDLQHIFLNSKFGFIQGNFNENHLLLDTKELENELNIYSNYMKNMANLNGWVCGLGHGINKVTPEKNVHLFIETITGILVEIKFLMWRFKFVDAPWRTATKFSNSISSFVGRAPPPVEKPPP